MNSRNNIQILFSSLFLFISSCHAQALRAKDILFQPYYALNYGIPLRTAVAEDGDVNIKTNSINAIGAMAQYFIADRISVGIDMNSRSETKTFDRNVLTFDPVQNLDIIVKQNHKIKTSLFRVYARMDYHLPTRHTRFDFYSGFCIGLKFQNDRKFINNIEQNFYQVKAEQFTFGNYSLRFCVGGRYMINRYIGLAGEIGLGGPLATVGIVVKI